MSVAQKVRVNINKMEPGSVFMLSDLPSYRKEHKATQQALSYYSKNEKLKDKYGYISRLADGVYYKEEIGILGKLPPSFDAIVHALTYSNNKKVGYIIGHELFHKRGLSTQVPSRITIVTSKHAPAKLRVSGIDIEIKRKVDKVKEKDINRLELEYILNNLDKIQDLSRDHFKESLYKYFDFVSQDEKQFKLLYKHIIYKKTKALFGALFEEYQEYQEYQENNMVNDFSSYINYIRKDLSSKSEYKIGRLFNLVDNYKAWNIKY